MKRIGNFLRLSILAGTLAVLPVHSASAQALEAIGSLAKDAILEQILTSFMSFSLDDAARAGSAILQATNTFKQIKVVNDKVGGLLDFTEELYSGTRAAQNSLQNIQSAVNSFYDLVDQAEQNIMDLKIYSEKGWLTSSEFQTHLNMVKYVINDAGLEVKYMFDFAQGPFAKFGRQSVMDYDKVPATSRKMLDDLDSQERQYREYLSTIDSSDPNNSGLIDNVKKSLSQINEEKNSLLRRSSYYGDFSSSASDGSELIPWWQTDSDGNYVTDADGKYVFDKGNLITGKTVSADGSVDYGKNGVLLGVMKTVEARTEEVRNIASRMQGRTQFLSDQRDLLWERVSNNMAIQSMNHTASMMLPHVSEPKRAPASIVYDGSGLKTNISQEESDREKVERGRKLSGDPSLDEDVAKVIADANDGTSGYNTSLNDTNEEAAKVASEIKLSRNGIFTIIYVLLGIMAIFFGIQVVIKMNKGERQSQDTMFKLLTGTLAAIIIITIFREVLFP